MTQVISHHVNTFEKLQFHFHVALNSDSDHIDMFGGFTNGGVGKFGVYSNNCYCVIKENPIFPFFLVVVLLSLLLLLLSLFSQLA